MRSMRERVNIELAPHRPGGGDFGINLQPLSPEELLHLDAADPRTKRGEKLDKERNQAKSLAKVWLISLFLAIIFFASLRVSD